jgi:hypothetical protein
MCGCDSVSLKRIQETKNASHGRYFQAPLALEMPIPEDQNVFAAIFFE